MSRSNLVCILLALLLVINWNNQCSVVAKVYTAGSTTVDVYIEYTDNFGSNTKCATFTSGAPDKYETICFSSIITDQGTFNGCEVKMDEETCNTCGPCRTGEEEVGFDIDCFNIEPAETTTSCVLFNDMTVQEVLVDDTFSAQPFDFSDNATRSTEDSDPAPAPASGTLVQRVTDFTFLSMAIIALISV